MNPMGPKILVVDDSALMRRALTDILERITGAEVRVARNGQEALDLIPKFEPDVVTLDVNMPVMDGLTCLSHIMTQFPRPVVMVSSITTKDSEASLEALSMGAIDIIEKPDGTVSKRMDTIANAIRRSVRGASKARVPVARAKAPAARPRADTSTPRPKLARSGAVCDRVVLIGISTGGPNSLESVIPVLPANLPVPIVIAQHMPPTFTPSFARRLDSISDIHVTEAVKPTPLEPGTAYVIHGGGDAILKKRVGRLVVEAVPAEKRFPWHPSVDRLTASALEVYEPEKVLGVLMTGMGDDGASTMTELRRRGGHTIAESEKTAIVYGMPRELAEQGGAVEIVDLERIARRIIAWAEGGS